MFGLNSMKRVVMFFSTICLVLCGLLGLSIKKIDNLKSEKYALTAQVEATGYVGCYPEFKDDVATLVTHGKKFEQTINNLVDKLEIDLKKFDKVIAKMSKLTGTDLNAFAEVALIEAINNLSPDIAEFISEAMILQDPMTRTSDFIIENSDKLDK